MKKIILAMVLLASTALAAAAPAVHYENTELVRVVDGDTIDLNVDLGFNVHAYPRFRLARINTPEKGQPGAVEATEAMKTRLAAGKITIDVKGHDTYGRWIAEVYVNGKNVNDTMLADKLAKPYP